jgi:hypothetical protein
MHILNVRRRTGCLSAHSISHFDDGLELYIVFCLSTVHRTILHVIEIVICKSNSNIIWDLGDFSLLERLGLHSIRHGHCAQSYSCHRQA